MLILHAFISAASQNSFTADTETIHDKIPEQCNSLKQWRIAHLT